MSTEEDWEKLLPVITRLLWQTYYRIFGMISFHATVWDSYNAAKWLSDNPYLLHSHNGQVSWVIENRVFIWEDVEVSPGIIMTVWFFGGPRNTVMVRRGWWTLYLVRTTISALGYI